MLRDVARTSAWMLRQDGEAFPVKNHLYCMDDEDLSSEAEVASFLIATSSKGQTFSEYVLDAWMALLIEESVPYYAEASDIDKAIQSELSSLPYKFPYDLGRQKLLSIHKKQNNYSNIDELYDFIDEVRDNITYTQSEITRYLNQQFCRVRFGGMTNSTGLSSGPYGSIWFRISSTGFNWSNTIYQFVASNKTSLGITSIFICRDSESDGVDDYSNPYFYKAKDGAVYYDMNIDEYLEEEHEHSTVFATISTEYTLPQDEYCKKRDEEIANCCILQSEFLDGLSIRSMSKVKQIENAIKEGYPAITECYVDAETELNRNGNPTRMKLILTIDSENPKLDGTEVEVKFNTTFNKTPSGVIINRLCKELEEYCMFSHINLFSK